MIGIHDGGRSDSPSKKTATVLLLCGLPGSGKSSLAKLLVESNDNTIHDHRFLHVEYDDLAKELQQQLDGSSIEEATENSQNDDDDENDHEKAWLLAWRKSRTQALQLVRKELDDHIMMNNTTSIDASNNSDSSACRHLIVIMDDNFFLRSMRRDVYKVCQQATAATASDSDRTFHHPDPQHDPSASNIPQHGSIYFGIIWMDASLDVCLMRNRQRTQNIVSDETIVNMNHRLEPPNPEKYEFEEHSLHIHGDETSQTNLISRVMEFIEACRRSTPVPLPPPPPELDAARVAEERKRTFESQLHTFDNMLRGWVGQVAQMERSAAGVANASRQRLLQRLRRQQQDGVSCDETNVSAWFECFWDDMVQSSSALQGWSPDQKDQLRRRVLPS